MRQQEIQGEHACHDSGVILGDVNLMACASGHMANVFDIGENEWEGGSLTHPRFLYTIEEEGVGPMPGADEHAEHHRGAQRLPVHRPQDDAPGDAAQPPEPADAGVLAGRMR